MSMREINTMISSVRSLYDENGNYLPSGNYFFNVKKFSSNSKTFSGLVRQDGNFGKFKFKCKDLVKMMAVSQSRLVTMAGLTYEEGMPCYPSPTNSVVRLYSPSRDRFSRRTYSPYRNHRVSRTLVFPVRREEETYDCTICMEEIDDDEKKTLGCNHHFHRNCINRWLNHDNRCPICRASHTSRSRSNVEFLRRDGFLDSLDELEQQFLSNNSIFRHK